MREIKFRAWHKEHSEMVIADTKNRISDKRAFATLIFDVGFSHFPDADEWVLMQFTGLRDKNRKNMIYEGDIVRDSLNKSIGVIEWEPSLCSFTAFSGRKVVNSLDAQYWEVIGNIHEHAHLLEDK